MENSKLRGIFFSAATALIMMTCPASATDGHISATNKKVATPNLDAAWQEFHSAVGNCSMKFPKYPDHLSEKMRLPEEGFDLKYDAYISAMDQKTVFLLLIAQYPDFVDETYARMSLEGFLNGILTHNPNNQLIFADLSLVGGHEALDFFIRTGGVYFKGRALMVKNSLYLMAMECEVQNYDEIHYDTFINSFQLVK
ncbi:MAG: hypothetical protein JSS61_05020 [Verrucomicrobia bacterium]|nr:hypothetical protein [Verrucomicrobiota bacterium]